MRAYKLPVAMSSYTDDYRNAEFIQESILKKYIFVPPGKSPLVFSLVHHVIGYGLRPKKMPCGVFKK